MRDKEQRKAYREANKERIRAYDRAYRAGNRALSKAYRDENKEQINERKRACYEATRERVKSQRRMRAYGINDIRYNEILARQNNCCAICNTHKSELKKDLSVDHDHNTGKVRGLLCNNCNIGIGLLKDSSEVVHKAHLYLIHHQELT